MNPWPSLRERCGEDVLVRVLDLDAGEQFFLRMPRTKDTEAYDGATVWHPAPATPEDRDALMEQADAGYAP